VLFDSGIRSGGGIAIALALGAKAVLIGRPYVYGLAVAGEAGVAAVFAHLLGEFDLTLTLSGARSAADLEIVSDH
jgi:isopentenyl diphosphate isomerase/L-lactate dehydrogenase-like FMN-dependent dehydrogenase